MTDQKITEYIINGIISTRIYGSFDSVEESTLHEYPSIGIGLWSLDEADNLLERLKGGFYFIDLPFKMINVNKLKQVLTNNQTEQIRFLTEHINNYVSAFKQLFTDDRMIICASLLGCRSFNSVYTFIKAHRSDVNNLRQLHDLFFNQYIMADHLLMASKNDKYLFRQRLNKIFSYVSLLDKD